MPDAPSLQLALHRRQTALIARAMEGRHDHFRTYEARYRRRARGVAQVLSREAVLQAALAADVLHVGDYHTLPQAQGLYLELVERARSAGRPLVLALECVEGRFQPLLDRLSTGALTADAFFEQLEVERPDALALWPTFRAMLVGAVQAGLSLLAIDLRASGPDALARRDTYAAARIAACAKRAERPRVLVLSGQFHVAPCHLPAAVSRALGTHAASVVQHTLFQNCEGPYFELLAQGRDPLAHGAVLEGGALCAFSASPTVAQRTFLDYLEEGDASLDGATPDVHLAVPELVREIALALGLPEVGTAPPASPALLVIPAGAHDVLAQLQARGRFSSEELATLFEHLRVGERLYVPRAHAICLSTLSRDDAAVEAARHLRHLALGSRRDADQAWDEAFYARVWDEALACFGAQVLARRRPAEGLAAWGRTLREGTGELRRIAAFVLEHKACEAAPQAAPKWPTPPRNPRLAHAAARALGHLLGEALGRAWREQPGNREALRELFVDPLEAPRARYLAWIRHLTPAARPRRSPRPRAQAAAPATAH